MLKDYSCGCRAEAAVHLCCCIFLMACLSICTGDAGSTNRSALLNSGTL